MRSAIKAIAAATLAALPAYSQMTGVTGAHDPSTLFKVGSKYYYYATGDGIVSRSSSNRNSWSAGPNVFATPPAWTTAAVPGFTGTFWAPDVAYRNGQYYLYYSVSTWGSQVSAVGVATSPTLNPSAPNYAWTDQGAVMQSAVGDPYNAIDPSIFQDTDGRMWMTYGSYWNGIYLTELNPATGKRLSTSVAPTQVANNSSIEASYLTKRDGYYYLFVNWGTCCQGVNSTYNIRVGRSTSVNGPFLDKDGVNLVNSGGTLFLGAVSNKIGPGHMSVYSEGEQEQFGFHYYDGNNNGTPTYGLQSLYWTSDAWPSATAISPNWAGTSNSNWSQGSNWSAGVPDGRGHTANFGTVSSNRYSVTLNSTARTLGAINFSGTASYNIGTTSGNAIIFDNTAASAAIGVTAGSHTIAAPITLNDDLVVTVAAASTLKSTGGISGAGRSITKAGTGKLVLAGTNSYSGNTVISAGTLQLPPRVVSIGDYSFDTAYDTSNNPVGSGSLGQGFTFANNGAGSTAVNGTVNHSDHPGAASGASLVAGRFGNALHLDGLGSSVDVNSQIVDQSGAASWTLSAWIKTTKQGSAIVSKNRGGTTWDVGYSTFYLGSNPPSGTPGSYPTAVRFAGGFVQGNSAIADGAWHMVTYVADAGTKQIYVDGAAVALTQSAFDNTDVSNFVRLGYNSDTLSSLDGNAHLQGDLDEMKFFNVSLTAQQIQQLYTANTVASASQQYLPTSTSVSLTGATAVFDLNNNDQTIASLNGVSGSIVNLGAGVLTTGGNGTSDTFAGNIIGVGGIVKTGAGSTTLNGTNTYTSATTVAAGALRLAGSARTPVETGPGGAILNGGTLIFDYSGGSSPQSQIVTALQTANASAFQSGRYRTTLATDTTKAIGWLDDGTSLFRLRYTLRGDLDLNGVVDSVDFNNFISGYGTLNGAIWKNGDVTYDGKIDTQDFNYLAGNFGVSPLGSVNLGSVIPEPASVGLLGLLWIGALRRRP